MLEYKIFEVVVTESALVPVVVVVIVVLFPGKLMTVDEDETVSNIIEFKLTESKVPAGLKQEMTRKAGNRFQAPANHSSARDTCSPSSHCPAAHSRTRIVLTYGYVPKL